MTTTMKKTYMSPTATAIRLDWENGVALNVLSGGNNPTIDSDEEVLSNKKENPIWEKSKNGMWDNMK